MIRFIAVILKILYLTIDIHYNFYCDFKHKCSVNHFYFIHISILYHKISDSCLLDKYFHRAWGLSDFKIWPVYCPKISKPWKVCASLFSIHNYCIFPPRIRSYSFVSFSCKHILHYWSPQGFYRGFYQFFACFPSSSSKIA